ncbi:MAG: transcription antitermination factor NusB [Calditrichaeota bacterium]|nr:transcription antitermination factor NusB [Calditrichota bacterium]RQV93114.1 MAG: transcription antitermination factor NusB [bacterium]RQW04324.1 MAG: transcription antitermination factor NusB [Calditrichota bacterium]
MLILNSRIKELIDHKDGDQNLSRRQARRFALQVLFCNEFLNENIDTVTERLAETLSNEVDDFSVEIIRKTSERAQKLDKLIIEGLLDRNIERLMLLEKVLLRMSLCELTCFPDIPVEVTLNEAVDLSKEFISYKSARFVNGILDTLFKKLEKENKLNKSLIARLPSRKSKILRSIKDVKL